MTQLINDSMNECLNHNGVDRTAPSTPALLKIIVHKLVLGDFNEILNCLLSKIDFGMNGDYIGNGSDLFHM